jgi:hypothetical protein
MRVEYNEDSAEFATEPEHGKPVTFVVTSRRINVAKANGSYWSKRYAGRFVVGLKGSAGDGFSHHSTFEAACKSALYRARRYERAYSTPRGLAA